jgi:hypothetical protein
MAFGRMVTFIIAILFMFFENSDTASSIFVGVSTFCMCFIVGGYVVYTSETRDGVTHQWFSKFTLTIQERIRAIGTFNWSVQKVLNRQPTGSPYST